MTTYLSAETQSQLAATLATKQSLRNLLRQMRESDNRTVARIADKAIVKALKHFSIESVSSYYGVSVGTVDRYRHLMLFGLPLPSVAPPPIDWSAVDADIRMGWHLEKLAQSMGPQHIMKTFGVSYWWATRAGEYMDGNTVMADADPELREAVITARNAYKATRAKRQTFTYGAIAERHGTSRSTIMLRARELRAAEQQDMGKAA